MTAPEAPGNGRRRPYQRSGFYAAKRALVKYGARILPGADTPIGRSSATGDSRSSRTWEALRRSPRNSSP
jgi:hypothetical protein